jgi:hypothetical protein
MPRIFSTTPQAFTTPLAQQYRPSRPRLSRLLNSRPVFRFDYFVFPEGIAGHVSVRKGEAGSPALL